LKIVVRGWQNIHEIYWPEVGYCYNLCVCSCQT